MAFKAKNRFDIQLVVPGPNGYRYRYESTNVRELTAEEVVASVKKFVELAETMMAKREEPRDGE